MAAHEAFAPPWRTGLFEAASHEVQLVATCEQLPHSVEQSWHSSAVSAYMRGGHAVMQLVASLNGVPVAGQLTQSVASPPTHCAHVASQLSAQDWRHGWHRACYVICVMNKLAGMRRGICSDNFIGCVSR